MQSCANMKLCKQTTNPQKFQLRLRNGATQRNRRAAGNSRIDNQRFCHPLEKGASPIPSPGPHPPPQAQVRGPLPPATQLLHHSVRGKRSRHSHSHLEGILSLLAVVVLVKAGSFHQRAGRNFGATGGRPTGSDRPGAVLKFGKVPEQQPLPSCGKGPVPVEQRTSGQQWLLEQAECEHGAADYLRRAVQEQQRALERNRRGACTKRAENVHGVRFDFIRQVFYGLLQAGGGEQEEAVGGGGKVGEYRRQR